jgi:hypothetical protein
MAFSHSLVFFIILQTSFLKIDLSKEKTTMTNQEITIKNNGESKILDPHFKHSTNGKAVDF